MSHCRKFSPLRVVLVGLVLIAGLSWNCRSDPDRKAILAVLEGVRVSMERLDYDAALAPVAQDYSDNVDNNGRNLKSRLQAIFSRFERLEIRVDVRELRIEGLTAVAKTKLKVDGLDHGKKEPLYGNPVRASELQIQLEKRSGNWRIVGSTVIFRRGIF
jgi:hypothetical protein